MPNEGTQQRWVLGDRGGYLLRTHEEFLKFAGREVGHRVCFGMAPDQFHGVQFRGVRWQQVRTHASRAREPCADEPAVVGAQPIPHEFDRRPHRAQEILQEGEDRRAIVIGIGQATEHCAHPPSRGRDRQRRDHRDFAPRTAALLEDRGVSARRPAASHEWRHQEARFVDEDERRVAAGGVFFTRGQSSLIQRAMAASSRSRARRVGFCGLHPRAWSKRPI